VVKPKEITERIKEEVKQIRQNRAAAKRSTSNIPNTSESLKPHFATSPKKTADQVRKKTDSELFIKPSPKKYTLLELGKISFADIAPAREQKFNLADLLKPDSDNEMKEDPEFEQILNKFRGPNGKKSVLVPSKLKNSYFIYP